VRRLLGAGGAFSGIFLAQNRLKIHAESGRSANVRVVWLNPPFYHQHKNRRKARPFDITSIRAQSCFTGCVWILALQAVGSKSSDGAKPAVQQTTAPVLPESAAAESARQWA